MLKVELHDGTILKDIYINGSCFATDEAITEATFRGKLKTVKIYDNEILKETINDAKLATCQRHPDGYMLFAFSPKTESEKTADTLEDIQMAIIELAELIGG